MENKELLNLIKKLLKKRPSSFGGFVFDETSLLYENGESTYIIDFNAVNGYVITLSIDNAITHYCNHYSIDVDEKDYMEIKWTMQNWRSVFEESEFNTFKEFAETDDTQMEDLLND